MDETALAKLAADAEAAKERLHILVSPRDGFLTGEKIRKAVLDWRDTSIRSCGLAGFGTILRKDFAARGFAVEERFRQELFDMRWEHTATGLSSMLASKSSNGSKGKRGGD